MKIKDQLHGFTVTNVRPVDLYHGTFYEMKHEKSGAQLAWLKREESNKTFSITFKTLPTDHTGVFHILEHSVLNGSDKYPVKEPFVELLKGSLQTFLNAMTFPDKTMYPVSSRNDKDFMNLMDVYMDAVLHTTIYTKKETFLQEGWHYEMMDEESPLIYNGVVYNEMKGAFSSIDTKMSNQMDQLLYPDNCYRFCSGGNPDYIPTLTYEQFLHNHEIYYHPSNGRIFLDGDIKIDDVLARLDEILSPYDDIHFNASIPFQQPQPAKKVVVPYEIREDEPETNKTQVAWGRLFSTFDNQKMNVAMAVLCDVLASSAKSPLKQAILESGLAEDMGMGVSDSIQQSSVVINVQNTDEQHVDTLHTLIRDTLTRLAQEGLDHKMIHGSLNNMEFQSKQRDSWGAEGVMLAMVSMESWLYDGDPLQNFSFEETFAFLREQVEHGYFEQLIQDVLLDENHEMCVVLTPSKTLANEKQQALEQTLQEIKNGWSDEEKKTIIAMNQKLREVQQREDTAEELATMPKLERSDINKNTLPVCLEFGEVEGKTVLWHPLSTNGISYVDMYFDMSDLTNEELSMVNFAKELYFDSDTEHMSSLDIQSEMKMYMGDVSVTTDSFTYRPTNKTTPCMEVSFCLLNANKSHATSLMKELLLHTKFDDKNLLEQFLYQQKFADEQSLTASGNAYAIRRVMAYSSQEGVITEYLRGYESMKWVEEAIARLSTDADAILEQFASLFKKIFTRERLTLSITGLKDEAWAKDLVEIFPVTNETVTAVERIPLGIRQEGIEISSGVGYAVIAGYLDGLRKEDQGTWRVLSKIMTYNYLWNEVRVQGGAYGTGFQARPSGFVSIHSYRDPQPAHSLQVYRNMVDYIHHLNLNDDEITKSIVGTISDLEPAMSLRSQGRQGASAYLCGVTHEERQMLRDQILATTLDGLRNCADTLEKMIEKKGICVVAGKSLLQTCTNEHLVIESK